MLPHRQFRVLGSPDRLPLQEHLAGTYFAIRWGLALIAFFLPLALWLGGSLAGVELQSSMSAYYHAGGGPGVDAPGDGPLRNIFVGALIALGALLYLYKGFSPAENLGLNLAGVLAVLVALFPMEWGCEACPQLTVHNVSAIAAFVCLAVVVWTTSSHTLDLIASPDRRKRYERAYAVFAALMLMFPIVAYVVTAVLDVRESWVFFVEMFGIWVFSGYWLTKALELKETRADTLALDGALLAQGQTIPDWSARPADM